MTELTDAPGTAFSGLDVRDHVVTGYRQGRSLTTLSEEIGRSYGYVRRLVLDAGVPLRPRGGARPRR